LYAFSSCEKLVKSIVIIAIASESVKFSMLIF
jgi:hypothetical protein